jgi:tetratricopeptide (TPR) repeat protein
MDQSSDFAQERATPASRNQGQRFRKGRSGNPRGRPKGRKLLSVIVREIMGSKVPVMQAGKRKRITKAEALVQVKLNAAIQGDAAAADVIIWLAEQAGGLIPADAERQGGVLVVPGVSKSREEWEKLHGAAARGEQFYDSDGLPRRAKITVPLSIEAGDKLVTEGKLDEALACFRRVAANAFAAHDRRPGREVSQEAFDAVMKIGYSSVHFILARRFDLALECLDEAIRQVNRWPLDQIGDPLFWLNLHRAFALMFVERADEARELFTTHVGKRFRDGKRMKTWEAIVVSTFDFYRKRGLPHPLMDEVERIFAGE